MKAFKAGITMLLVAFILMWVAADIAGAATIDTYTGWDGFTTQGLFGNGAGLDLYAPTNTATLGQVVTAPGTTLSSFTFYLAQETAWVPNQFTYEAYVYAWNGARATGPALWSSGPIMGIPSGSTPQAVTFTPGVSVASGSQYVFFLSVSKYFTTNDFDGAGVFAFNYLAGTGDTYFVVLNNGGNSSLWTGSDWDQTFNYGSLAMKADFNNVPLPGAIVLLGPGLLGLFALRRRARR